MNFRKLSSGVVALFLMVMLGSEPAEAQDFFRDTIAPILVENCLACHNEQNQEGGFSLQTAASFFADGHVDPGEARNSHLIDLVTAVDGQAEMPNEGEALADSEVTELRAWIDKGAVWPEGFRLEERVISDYSWWSFQPVQVLPVPEWNRQAGDRNQIDGFISRRLREKGLRASVQADLHRNREAGPPGIPAKIDILASPRGQHHRRTWGLGHEVQPGL